MLNHLNLAVESPPDLARFLVTYAGMTLTHGDNPAFMFLTDANGVVLGLMRDRTAAYPATFHIGFILADPAALAATRARLESDGHAVTPEGSGESFHLWIGALMIQLLAKTA